MSTKAFSEDVIARDILQKQTPKKILQAYVSAKGYKFESYYDYVKGGWVAFVCEALAKGTKPRQYEQVKESWHKTSLCSSSLEAQRLLGYMIKMKLEDDLAEESKGLAEESKDLAEKS